MQPKDNRYRLFKIKVKMEDIIILYRHQITTPIGQLSSVGIAINQVMLEETVPALTPTLNLYTKILSAEMDRWREKKKKCLVSEVYKENTYLRKPQFMCT